MALPESHAAARKIIFTVAVFVSISLVFVKEGHVSGGAESEVASEYFVITAYTPRKRPINYERWAAQLAEWKIEIVPTLEYFKSRVEEFLVNRDMGKNLKAYDGTDTEHNLKIFCDDVPAWESFVVTLSFKELPDESVRQRLQDGIEAVISGAYEYVSHAAEASEKYAGRIRAMDGKESDAVSVTSVWLNQPLLCGKCEYGRAGADGYFDIESKISGMSVRINAGELHDVECHNGRFDQDKIDILEDIFSDMEE